MGDFKSERWATSFRNHWATSSEYAVNDKVRLLAKLGAALIAAKAGDADLNGAVTSAVGWEKLAASVAEAERLIRPDKVDLPALAARA